LRLALKANLFNQMPSDDSRMFIGYLLVGGVTINLGLACFNLIPFGPLDGHWLVGLLLPEKQRYYWFKFNRQIGMPGLFVAVILLQATNTSLLLGPISYLFHLFAGTSIGEAYNLVFR